MRSKRLQLASLLLCPAGMKARRLRALIAFALLTLPTAGSAQSDARPAAGWFRVTWAPSADHPQPVFDGAPSRIRGDVLNDSPYRVTNVRLEIEGLSTDNRSVGRTFAWGVGDIAPGGTTYFAVEPIPGSVSYRATVVSWDLVSLGQAP